MHVQKFKMIDFAQSLYENRKKITAEIPRLNQLLSIVNRPSDLSLAQWIQLYSFAGAFSPDLIIELGRGCGNSTTLFTELANNQKNIELTSVGFDGERYWEKITNPALKRIVSNDWF